MDETFVTRGRDEDLPASIGPYRVLGKIGEGGMGVVYLAEQRTPVQRRVALKLIKLGMDTKAVIARFRAEQQALARMEHPGIARVYDAGVADGGRPYFCMEYIKGDPITDYCDQHKLTLEDRLRLFQRVCTAVHHAHERGIVHRDLKPSNVLITTQGSEAEPRIIDFGLAKAINHRLVEETVFTEHGQLLGTPEYMAPEQCGLSGLDVDQRTDIYSLGVLLYELLTGSVPLRRETLLRGAYAEIQRILQESVPPRPSTRLTEPGTDAAKIATARQLDPATLRSRLQHGLDDVVMQCLQKDRTQRPPTTLALHTMIEQFLQGSRRWRAVTSWRGIAVAAALGFGAGTAAMLPFVGGPAPAPTADHYTVIVGCNPPEASVYINGTRFGSGDRHPVSLDFTQHPRCYLLAVAPGYHPQFQWITAADCEHLKAANLNLNMTLRPR